MDRKELSEALRVKPGKSGFRFGRKLKVKVAPVRRRRRTRRGR